MHKLALYEINYNLCNYKFSIKQLLSYNFGLLLRVLLDPLSLLTASLRRFPYSASAFAKFAMALS